MRNNDFKDKSMIYFTDSMNPERATIRSNTYILSVNGRDYIIDTSFGKKRYRDIKSYLKGHHCYSILCTHYHNDHIANNGRLARKDSPVIYHVNAVRKINYLRTNASGQILMMFREMQKEGFLKRLGLFSDAQIRLLLKRKIYSKYIAEPLLFTASYLMSIKSIGRIYTGKRYVTYLDDSTKTAIQLNGMKVDGWKLDDSFYAFEAPGHTDCHTVFYLQSSRLLVAGDALNFLTPNDIQFGTMRDTLETQKFLLQLASNENVEVLCQGHYPPVAGNENIINYITDIIEKHEHIYNLAINFIDSTSDSITFDELYSRFCAIDDPVLNRLKKITFPRSTLVFLDVYLLKMLEEKGRKPGGFIR